MALTALIENRLLSPFLGFKDIGNCLQASKMFHPLHVQFKHLNSARPTRMTIRKLINWKEVKFLTGEHCTTFLEWMTFEIHCKDSLWLPRFKTITIEREALTLHVAYTLFV